MNSILKQELVGLKSSVNYWLGIGWIAVIIIAIISIILLTLNKSTMKTQEKERKFPLNESEVKGFKNNK